MNTPSKIPFLMKMVTDRVDTMITRDLAAQKITASQGRVLAYLTSRDGELVSQKDVEQHLGVSHTTAKGIVQRLEEKNMVTTAFDSTDGRVKNIYLTDHSRAMHCAIKRRIVSIEEVLLKGIPEEERDRLELLLQRLYDNIK